MPKRTYQGNKRKLNRTHGFLVKSRTKAGASVIRRRRARGRKKIAPSAYTK